MTMELGHEFSLAYAFEWNAPISVMTQESITTYGSDDDRVRLAEHFSVTIASLEALSELSSPEVRLAVARNPLTPLQSLARMSHDPDHAVKAAVNDAINDLPDVQRVQVRGMIESPMQRLKARFRA